MTFPYYEIPLIYTNIDSVHSKWNELCGLVSDYKPDIICLTETKLSSSIPDSLVKLPNYSIFRCDRNSVNSDYISEDDSICSSDDGDKSDDDVDNCNPQETKSRSRGGGVCIYLHSKILTDFSISHIEIPLSGIEAVCLKFERMGFHMLLLLVYRPPSCSATDTKALIEKVNSLNKDNLSTVILGDFNFPTLPVSPVFTIDPKNSVELFGNMICACNFQQLVTEFTRYRNFQRPSRLDLLLTNDSDLFADLKYYPPLGKSDHVVINSSMQITQFTSSRMSTKLFNVTDWNAVSLDLASLNWETCLGCVDIEEMWDNFSLIVDQLLTKHTKQKSSKINVSQPWIGPEVRGFLRRKRKLWQVYRRTGSPEDYLQHRKFSNWLMQFIKSARTSYEGNLANGGNKKKFYKYIRSKLCSKVSTPVLRDIDGSTCSLEGAAELLAKHFTSAFTEETSPPPVMDSNSRSNSHISEVEFSPETIWNKISGLSVNAAPGPDGLSPGFLKRYGEVLCKPLSLIMSASFLQSKLPKAWKTASVTPIFKKGNKLSPENYRPISLTSVACKLMESVINDRVRDFLLSSNRIPAQQHGFLPGRSIITSMLDCVDKWTLAVDSGQPIDIIYLDFSRAFDSVPLNRLIYKLDHCGIRGKLLSWIEAFVKQRSFRVRVGGSYSGEYAVLSGVPQGTILAPSLFIMYCSDLPSAIHSNTSMYADDMKIYGNPVSDFLALQADLEALENWCSKWLLSLNVSKCVVLHVGKHNPRYNYNICGTSLQHVASHCDLGITVTEDLSWTAHVQRICKQANKQTYLIRKCFSRPSFTLCRDLYLTYIRPIIEFGGPVWHPILVQNSALLEAVQRRATRMGCGVVRPSYPQRMRIMNLTTFSERRARGDLIMTYKILNNKLGCDLRHLFVLNTNEYLRGHNLKLCHQSYKTRTRETFLPNRVFNEWNCLPVEAVDAPSCCSFKARLDTWNSA